MWFMQKQMIHLNVWNYFCNWAGLHMRINTMIMKKNGKQSLLYSQEHKGIRCVLVSKQVIIIKQSSNHTEEYGYHMILAIYRY